MKGESIQSMVIHRMGPDFILILGQDSTLSEIAIQRSIYIAQFLKQHFPDRVIQIAGGSLGVPVKSRFETQFIEKTLMELDLENIRLDMPEPVIHEIPVRYDSSENSDIHQVAALTGRSVHDCFALHHSQQYQVFMLGFMPGFAYLGTLPDQLQIPRKSNPSVRIPAGSVAIAGSYTGIYPIDSPGGWYVIGSADYEVFNAMKPPYVRFNLLDIIQFVPID